MNHELRWAGSRRDIEVWACGRKQTFAIPYMAPPRVQDLHDSANELGLPVARR
jgi:hypothetical protein